MRRYGWFFQDAGLMKSKVLAVGGRLTMMRLLILSMIFYVGVGNVSAFDLPIGNDDWKATWNNTIRYTLMNRVADQDDDLLSPLNANGDDGNRNFDKGIVSNRFDLLSEFDIVYKMDYGFRISGAAWYDHAYDTDFDNDSIFTYNNLVNGVPKLNTLSDEADKYYKGPDADLLDAFLFGKINVGSSPIYLKAGRHIYSWGQALINPINSINYGQMPLDLQKAAAMPGVEAKEVFRPTSMISAVAQVTPEFQLAGQYFLEWERNRLPLEGSYFSTADVALKGAGVMIGPAGYIRHGRNIEAEDHRDFGIAAQYNPLRLWGGSTTFGLYYRETSDRMPQLVMATDMDTATFDTTYHANYKSGIKIYGVSLSTVVLYGTSLGLEVSYRQDMPLVGSPVALAYGSALGPGMSTINDVLPDEGHIVGASGDTYHVVLNLMRALYPSALWDGGSWVCEFNYNTYDNVDDPKGVFKGSKAYSALGYADGVTDDAATINFNFTPQYYQVIPGGDLDIPLKISYGLWGNSAVSGGGTEETGSVGIGAVLTYQFRHTFQLDYVNFFGNLHTYVNNVPMGATSKDRDFVSFTYKFSF